MGIFSNYKQERERRRAEKERARRAAALFDPKQAERNMRVNGINPQKPDFASEPERMSKKEYNKKDQKGRR